jgi:hypothetical protein
VTAALVALSLVVLVLCVLVAGLLRAYASLLRRVHLLDGGGDVGRAGAEAGAQPRPAAALPDPAFPGRPAAGPALPAPVDQAAHDVAGTAPDGEVVQLRVVDAPQESVLLFLSSSCPGCGPYWDDLASGGARRALGDARLVVVTQGPQHESPAEIARLAPPGVDVVMSDRAWADYEIPGSPFVVVVGAGARTTRGHGTGADLGQVLSLVGRADGDRPVRKRGRDAEREEQVDDVLRSAGIGPGHPSLYGSAR